ncbi:MAG: pilus assembly protein [Verrucomicrobia bacterium]|nr:pilus assembly protein [Verrucomicrobiota bacterium]MCG2681099.1 pilus assembly protein [Kiritimatiellia bacterium]MBU4248209.1 pilus assembly protein [Verrucomicrobiota bacterium]MBU4292323.1 pilus assembly protein [Verrucomicrobiota bacterium]MBU4428627.1 pilus assembly protein [Verrucomicrobiota bacterium]
MTQSIPGDAEAGRSEPNILRGARRLRTLLIHLHKTDQYPLLANAIRRSQAPNSIGAAGQSLIESCIVIGILCLLLMALFQLSQLFMAQEILHYAAGRGARAKTVGFNEFMVFKTVRVGTIANAGQITAPEMTVQTPSSLILQLGTNPSSPNYFETKSLGSYVKAPAAQRTLERSRIPLFLASDWNGQLSAILNYEDWTDINYSYTEQASPPQLDLRVHQHFQLKFPFHQLFYADDSIPFTGTATLDNHYPLYLDIE